MTKQNQTPTPVARPKALKWSEQRSLLRAALEVIAQTKPTREWLTKNDPKALAQVTGALTRTQPRSNMTDEQRALGKAGRQYLKRMERLASHFRQIGMVDGAYVVRKADSVQFIVVTGAALITNQTTGESDVWITVRGGTKGEVETVLANEFRPDFTKPQAAAPKPSKGSKASRKPAAA